MRIAFFYHSILSDWNNGNAHFLRGIVTELQARGHDIRVFEPENGWSLQNLIRSQGRRPVHEFRKLFPTIRPNFYDPAAPDLQRALEGVDLVIVHEWNEAHLVRRIGRLRQRGGAFKLLFHDTHHHCFSAPQRLRELELENFDGVLAFGEVLRDYFLRKGFGPAWIWHEAADTRIFYPRRPSRQRLDLIWIGNGGDGERNQEYEHFLLQPIRALGLGATVYGVRYTREDLRSLQQASIYYGGWLPNYRVPDAFAGHRLALHILRRPYAQMLKGIPTIRPFEALACGIPLICTPWEDTENLFTPGKDFLMAGNTEQMKTMIRDLLNDADLASEMVAHGRETILKRHTCRHRVDELLKICTRLGLRADIEAAQDEQNVLRNAGKP